MWNSIHKYGLSDKEIQEIADRLIKEEKEQAKPDCPDCGAETDERHHIHCDVARLQSDSVALH